ncbi:PREDICTED: paired amphipathic helix protein Sin3-like 3 [Camelina sativa]|uniref:Paired amphipathic helix protein Sin3-like 3 n=1 Tax=Camelina sativa TaxID=90675 RepID=A0ABM1QWA2_CAMSA|nr:PREDICTED: paired amphipathic helix protein Sin3-like 3 [Camelina sativa]
MVRTRLSAKAAMDDTVSYLTAVKEAFRVEPAKFKEFLKILNDFKNHRMYKDSGIARMTELIKGHPKLLLGLSVFLPKAKTTIPAAKANKVLGQSQTISVIKVSPELTTLNKSAYLASLKEAFRNESGKYNEWHNILKDFKPLCRIDEATVISRMEELMKNHRKLLLSFSVFLSAGAKITIPPEAEQHITSAGMTISPEAEQHITSAGDKMIISPEVEQHIVSDNNKRKRAKCDDPDYDPDIVNKPKV